MNILAISKMSIYDQMEIMCINEAININQNLAVKIIPINLDNHHFTKIINKVNTVVFQSKNAVKYSLNLHNDLMREKKNFFCLGKYSVNIINEMIGVSAECPASEYTSENVADLILKNHERINGCLIIKGRGGRSVIKERLERDGVHVSTIDVYHREPRENFIKIDHLDAKSKNYVIVSSEMAIKNFLDNLGSDYAAYDIIFVVPNQRLLTNLSYKNIRSLIIKNSSSAYEYLAKIKECANEF